jgi:EpsI family protein
MEMKQQAIILAAVILIAGIFGNFLRFVEQMPDQPADFGKIPMSTDGYLAEEHRFSELSYDVLQADTTTLRRYIGPDGESLWLFIAYFSSQKYGSQIHSPKHCLPGGGWLIEHIEPYKLVLDNGPARDINRLIIAEADRKELMFYWFETRGGSIRNEFGLKFDLMKNSLVLRPTDAAIIRLTLAIEPGENIDAATARAVEYFNVFMPSITEALPFVSR